MTKYKRIFSEDTTVQMMRGGGFGIGLNIVLSICEKYKIKLGLDSKKGEVSTFVLTFPKNK